MKRMPFAVFLVMIVIAFAMPRAEVLSQGQGKGKGGSKDPEPNYFLQLTIHDNFPGTQLISDGMVREDPNIDVEAPFGIPDFDEDMDGIGDLTGPFLGIPIIYQDQRINLVDGNGDPVGPYPDPCPDFNLSANSSPGRTRLSFSPRLPDTSRCDLSTNPPYEDDARTFTLLFDKNDGGGGSCACGAFSYLADPVYDNETARSTFIDNEPAGFCTLTLAAGAIVWPDDSGNNVFAETAAHRITAWPFEDLQNNKKNQKKSGQSVSGYTDVEFDFKTDIIEIGDPNAWGLNSKGEIILVTVTGPDTRVITSTGDAFNLSGPAQCSDVSMTFKITVKRIAVNPTG